MSEPTTTEQATRPLTDCTDWTPEERHVVEEFIVGTPYNSLCVFTFKLPGGGVRLRYAWTPGGDRLGDRIDREALGRRLDAADSLHITDMHATTAQFDGHHVETYALTAVLMEVIAGRRCPDGRRSTLRRMIEIAGELTGQEPQPGLPRWLGLGPVLISRKTA